MAPTGNDYIGNGGLKGRTLNKEGIEHVSSQVRNLG